jgi:hypothetical protein
MICRTSDIGVGCPIATVIPFSIQPAASTSSITRCRRAVFIAIPILRNGPSAKPLQFLAK